MEDIKTIITEISNTTLKQGREGLLLYEQWESIAGRTLSVVSRPVSIKNGVLLVAVKNSVALQELIYKKNSILNNIHAVPGMSRIKDIKPQVRVDQELNGG